MSVRAPAVNDQHRSATAMDITPTAITGVLIIEPRVFGDARGFFMETWQQERYRQVGLPDRFVQDNLARSERGVLRGLHFQHPRSQGKLVQVLAGEVFDVAVDIRPDSPTFRQWTGAILTGDNKRQFWVPAGLAHGYMVLSDEALLAYKCTELYSPQDERSIRWDDPDLGIEWPLDGIVPLLSERDREAPMLSALPVEALPRLADR
jgi:dTDP-4-dehydrorhamnose 3,5-epimerase